MPNNMQMELIQLKANSLLKIKFMNLSILPHVLQDWKEVNVCVAHLN